jgi:predicted ATPase/class 3 adenylate cyclase
MKFCGECGAPLVEDGHADVVRESPTAERRLVSVLFADLVGFTTLSETRDAEEVRDLLSRYFDTSRTLITRYGGIVEKFIGDAVMAVWGTPVAREDDAERAVRAALELVASMAALGEEVGAPDLRARAGVLTGEAVVTIGAEGQGMVAGDLVNTASRIQSAAEPGTVLVGERTRRATEAAIAYEDAHSFELKGKVDRVQLSRATRVVAGRGGALKSTGLEAPFVGRDRELSLVKERFHATVEESKTSRVSVMGIAGIGKSRLSWELYKYLDGLAQTVWWHRGRCLPYGDGVTYWALAEMVRMRAGIAEGEDSASALAKLRACVEEHIVDPEERAWVQPRLAHLLSLEDRAAASREDLFAGWRLFFERLAERTPTVLVFEDCQWADAALVDFIEYLLDWSRDSRLLVLTLSRPEVADRHPALVSARRASTSIYLEPLPRQPMEALLSGLVPGLPEVLRERILDRAEGVPLYAVETVRMLLDRGLLERQGDRFAVTGPVDVLEVPETLQALIAARLDGLPVEERGLLQNAAVAGKTFSADALVALSGMAAPEVDTILASLVRKELMSVQTDPRAPERGHYVFLQALVRKVAYETISLRERKRLHLALAGFLETSWGAEEEEVVEIVASHLLEAYRAAPDAEDAPAIKDRARECLVRAGQRAASLAAMDEAQQYFERAAELASGPEARAKLLERAGAAAYAAGRGDRAITQFEQAMHLFEEEGMAHPAARVSARMAEILWERGQIEKAIENMEASFAVLVEDEPDADLAMLAAQLGRLLYFTGDVDRATERIDDALRMAERLWLPEALSQSLNTKSLILDAQGRHEEARALLKHSLDLALEHDAPLAAFRAFFNLAHSMIEWDQYESAVDLGRRALALARKIGDRGYESNFLAQIALTQWITGGWDQALEGLEAIYDSPEPSMIAVSRSLPSLVHLLANRGAPEAAQLKVEGRRDAEHSAGVLERADYLTARAILLRATGDPGSALEAAVEALKARTVAGLQQENLREAWVEAAEAAFDLGDPDRVHEVLAIAEEKPSAHTPRYLEGHRARFESRLAVLQGDDDRAQAGFRSAAATFREMGALFCLAVTLLEHGEWLAGQGRTGEAEPLLGEAREIFERLKASPWLGRLDGLGIVGQSAPQPVASQNP